MYLVTALELAKREEGYDRPLTAASTPIVEEAAQAGTDVLEKVLDRALDKKLYGAAMAAMDLLGDRKTSRSCKAPMASRGCWSGPCWTRIAESSSRLRERS